MHASPTIRRDGGARATSRWREGGDNERGGEPTAPQPANPLTAHPHGRPRPASAARRRRGGTRDPSEGLHEGAALGRGVRGKSATPKPTIGPRGRDCLAAPLQPSGGGARGPEAPSHSPPPPPRAQERTEADRRDGGPAPPRRGRYTRVEGGTAAATRAPSGLPARSRPARCQPTADRRRPGRRKRSGPYRGRPGEGGGANQGGGVPPPSLPPRRTDPLAANRAAPGARSLPATPTA